MKVKALFSAYGLTEGKIYEVEWDCYESVYEVRLNNGKYACRNKDFFKVVAKD